MKWLLFTMAGLALFALACDTDDGSDGPIVPEATSSASSPSPSSTTTSRIRPSEAIVEQIRLLIPRALNVNQDAVRDVDLEGRNLTITLDEEQSLGGPTDFEGACQDVTQAIGFTDLSVVIKSASGSVLAECSMTD